MLGAIEGVLDEYKDMMLPKMPNRLPPRREEDHKIKLGLRAKPLVMRLYRIESLELEELRKQWKELLDVGFIQPFEAPYRASVLL